MRPGPDPEYPGKLHRLVDRLRGVLSPEDEAVARRLIDHNEGPEAMLTIAWSFDAYGQPVPAAEAVLLASLVEGLIEASDWPPSFPTDPNTRP